MRKTARIYLLSLLIIACSGLGQDINLKIPLDYHLETPGKVYELPEELIEISGLDAIDDRYLTCIQDEDGIVFIFDAETGKVINQLDFDKEADFEGVAVAGKDLYVLESNGDLYRIKKFMTNDKFKYKKYKTKLDAINDAEGLHYDKSNNRLLIALKSDDHKKYKNKKLVYAFDLDEKEITKKPAFVIDLEEIEDFLINDTFTAFSLRLQKIMIPGSSDVFKPSGISVHPFTGEIFILSANHSLMAIYTANGLLKYVHPFDAKLFMQPEGIAFTPDGTLYISNEGNDRKGNIVKFDYKKTE